MLLPELSAGSAAGAIAARLVSAYANHDTGLTDYLDGLDPHELLGLVPLLESNIRCRAGSVPLLQVLLDLHSTRLPAARSVIRLTQAELLTGQEALLCLSELRIAVMRHWEQPPEAGLLGPPEQEARSRLDALLLLSEDVLAVLEHRRPSAEDGAAQRDQVGPCAATLQLLPALLGAADKVHAELQETSHGGGGGSGCGEPSQAVLARLLGWPCRLPLMCVLLSTLEDFPLTPSQQAKIRRFRPAPPPPPSPRPDADAPVAWP